MAHSVHRESSLAAAVGIWTLPRQLLWDYEVFGLSPFSDQPFHVITASLFSSTKTTATVHRAAQERQFQLLLVVVQMKLPSVFCTNNNNNSLFTSHIALFHHFLLPPSICVSLPPDSSLAGAIISQLWLHGGWIWFIFTLSGPFSRSSSSSNNINRDRQRIEIQHRLRK